MKVLFQIGKGHKFKLVVIYWSDISVLMPIHQGKNTHRLLGTKKNSLGS